MVEPVQADLSSLNAMTERIESLIEDVRNSEKVEHHRHTIDIRSNWFFFSWVVLVIIIFALFWMIVNQRQTIGQYKDNDLKYRYIKMYEQTDEENIYRLEWQCKYIDSIKIICKQVEKY
jgi:ATP-dependent Zn protease